jgi:hypothetical protein
MKNIHLIHVNRAKASLYHCSNTRDFFTTEQTSGDLLYELYITSDEEIKEGDWYYLPRTNSVHKCIEATELNLERRLGVAKIILTTDLELIADGVQAIDNEFLEWFVKNPSCENVEVKPLLSNNGRALFGYKIIIPKEEPKYPIGGYAPGNYSCKCVNCKIEFTGDKRAFQCEPCAIKTTQEKPKQETPKEAAVNAFNDFKSKNPIVPQKHILPFKLGYIEGAEWQAERMYSEEEVLQIINSFEKLCYNYQSNKDWFPSKKTEWFKQFKKK